VEWALEQNSADKR